MFWPWRCLVGDRNWYFRILSPTKQKTFVGDSDLGRFCRTPHKNFIPHNNASGFIYSQKVPIMCSTLVRFPQNRYQSTALVECFRSVPVSFKMDKYGARKLRSNVFLTSVFLSPTNIFHLVGNSNQKTMKKWEPNPPHQNISYPPQDFHNFGPCQNRCVSPTRFFGIVFLNK